MNKLRVGILGCGTIGFQVALQLKKKYSRHAEILFLCDHHKKKASALKKRISTRVKLVSYVQLVQRADLIIEAAGTEIAADLVRRSFRLGKKVLVMSVGGLLDDPDLLKLKPHKGARLWIPSGAVAGVDGLHAARNAKIKSVRLITRKPPRGLQGAPYFKRRVFPKLMPGEEKRVFRGTALQAVKAFPQNINVAAVLSLAGIGPRKTIVEIWTSRRYKTNQHEIFAKGDFGTISSTTTNVPSLQNPKTSYMAVLSAMAVLEDIFSPIKIGN